MRLIAIFAAASLSLVALGALVGALSDIPPAVWLPNAAAWLIGALAATALAVYARAGWLPVLLLAAPAALAASFLGDGLSGVHRWIEAGPLRLNAAMLTLPMLAVSLASARGVWRWAAALTALALLVLQPDASQATALAAAAALVALRGGGSPLARAAAVAASAGLAGMAWLRPDPLEPVPEVEGIVGLAAKASPLLCASSLALLAAAAMVPALVARRAAPDLQLAAAALTACLGVWTLAPFYGAFPVPFMGVGPSPILGAWLGVGLLAGLIRASPAPVAAAGRRATPDSRQEETFRTAHLPPTSDSDAPACFTPSHVRGPTAR